MLFGCDRGKVDRMGRPHRRLCIGAGNFQQDAAAGAVVSRAVVDVVALSTLQSCPSEHVVALLRDNGI